jgi:hypothetical protein
MKKLKNLLAENMRRFGTKNLSEEFSDIEKLAFGGPRDPKTGNTLQLSQEAMVTVNGKQHAVLASAFDEASINPNDSFTANKIREAGANPTNWVLLQATPGPYDSAYDDLGSNQLRAQWNSGAWMFAPAAKLQPAIAGSSIATTTLETGSWEAFTAAIANRINTNKNDPRTNLTSAEIDSAYEKMSNDAQNDLWNGIWGEYKWSVGANKPVDAENAVDQAIRDYFSKVKK